MISWAASARIRRPLRRLRGWPLKGRSKLSGFMDTNELNMPQCLYIRMYDGCPVACGKCVNCRNKRVTGWAARLMKHEESSDIAFFVTMTYNTDNLMFCPKGRPTLYPNHLTMFWKKLRKLFKPRSISYYVCGEYGSNKQRPHYHALIFFKDDKLKPITALKNLEKSWDFGEIFVGTITEESVAYTLKYISKKPSVPQYRGDTRLPEFQRTSKGLGRSYLSSNALAWHTDLLTDRAYIPLKGGNKAPMPRYFKDKIYTKEEKRLIGEHMEQKMQGRDYHTLKNLQNENVRKLNK